MLRDIEGVATEALLYGFAPAALALAPDSALRPELLYQQFALLHARLMSREFEDAMALVLANPHRAWIDEREKQHPGRPLRPGAHLSRALTRSGPRVDTRGRLSVGSVPRHVDRNRTESTLDSIPNRFVLYALSRWRSVAQQLTDALGPLGPEPGPVRRGRDAAAEVLMRMDRYLGHPLFREVAPLRSFPTANQTLLKQAGYRDLLRTFALGEVGSRLALDLDVDDIFAASQRNAAALYEYWTFLQLADAVGAVCGSRKGVEVLQPAKDGLSIGFRQGAASGLTWRIERAGREFDISLFNRTFLVSSSHELEASWTRAMRPDCSLHIQPRTRTPELADPGDLDVWLHFDAKYRVERAREQFDASKDLGDDAASEAESIERLSRSRREDLLQIARLPRRDPADRRRLRTLSRQRKRRTVSRVPRAPSGARGLRAPAGQLADGVRAGRHRGIPVGRCTPRGRSGNAARARSILAGQSAAHARVGYLRGHGASRHHVAASRRPRTVRVRSESAASRLDRVGWAVQRASGQAPRWALGRLLRASRRMAAPVWSKRPGVCLGTSRWMVRPDARRSDCARLSGAGRGRLLCCPVTRAPSPPEWIGHLDIGVLRPDRLAWGHPFVVNWARLLAAGSALRRPGL